MKFSFQTVWIIFGVTLAHLFVISALSPTGGERRNPTLKVIPGTTASPGETTGTNETETVAGTGADASIGSGQKAEEAPEVAVEKDSSAAATEEQPAPATPTAPRAEEAAVPAETVVKTATEEGTTVSADPPALSSPLRVIREIRDLKPLRGS